MTANKLDPIIQEAQSVALSIKGTQKIADQLIKEIEELKNDATISRQEMSTTRTEIDTILNETRELNIKLKTTLEIIEKNKDDSSAKFQEIKDTLQNSITTSLGGAFTKKELDSRRRDWIWLSLLVGSVICIYFIAHSNYEKISTLIDSKISFELILIQMFLGLGALAAPIWISWLSTKRLSKIYAITEDYSYKAALAQAYQGYRDAYKGTDDLMEQRLLATVVTQLDANPVRFIDSNHPATPLQDLLQQPWMQEIINNNQDTKNKLIGWFKEKFPKLILPK